MQAVILAAGYGLRLRPFTEKHPKGLVPILDKPLLAWTLDAVPQKIAEIIIVTGWLGEQIKETFGNTHQGRRLTYVTQEPINGTGSALWAAKDLLYGPCLVVNGDDLYDKTDLETLSKYPGALLAKKTTKPVPGALTVDENNFVTGIQEDVSPNEKWQNCGAYMVEADFFNLPLSAIPVRDNTEYSLPHTLLSPQNPHKIQLIQANRWLPIGTPEELAKAEEILQNI